MMNYFTINPYTASPHPQQVFVVENIKSIAAPMESYTQDGAQPKKRGRKRKVPVPDPSFALDQTLNQQTSPVDSSGSAEQLSPSCISTSDEGDDRSTKRRKMMDGFGDQKTKHNLTSKKGRMRINTEIMALKELLPECREVECNKASILHCTVQTLQRFHVTTSQLALTNSKLEKDNKKIIKMNKRLWEEIIKLRTAMGEAVPNMAMFEEDSNEQEERVLAAGQVYETAAPEPNTAAFPQYAQQSSPLPQMEVHSEISIPMTAMALAEQALPSTEYGAVPSFVAYPSLPTDFASPTKTYMYADSAPLPETVPSFTHSSSFDFSAADFNMLPSFSNYNASLMFVLFFTVPFLFNESAPVLTATTSGATRTLNWIGTAADSWSSVLTPSVLLLALAALCLTVVLVCWALSLRSWHKDTARAAAASISLPIRRRRSARRSLWSSVARLFSAPADPAPLAVKQIQI